MIAPYEPWTPALLPASAAHWPLVARRGEESSLVRVGDAVFGGEQFVVIGGPCSVESAYQIDRAAAGVASSGGLVLRGGAFKPRTNPYAFAGLGWEGVDLLAAAGRRYGLPVVSEVMAVDQVERMAQSIDMLQVGARNMQNFDLLRAVGRSQRPVLLKRGMSATLDELLCAAEYIVNEGNSRVVLCERGIRSFDTSTRNTLDLGAIVVLRERTHLPIIVDPSHAVGVRRWIPPLCRAAQAVGAHGLMIEVHPDPEAALCDRDQALDLEDFATVMESLTRG